MTGVVLQWLECFCYCAWAHWSDSGLHWPCRERGKKENHVCLSVAVKHCFYWIQGQLSLCGITAVTYNTRLSCEQWGCSSRPSLMLSKEIFIHYAFLFIKRAIKKWFLLEMSFVGLLYCHVACILKCTVWFTEGRWLAQINVHCGFVSVFYNNWCCFWHFFLLVELLFYEDYGESI